MAKVNLNTRRDNVGFLNKLAYDEATQNGYYLCSHCNEPVETGIANHGEHSLVCKGRNVVVIDLNEPSEVTRQRFEDFLKQPRKPITTKEYFDRIFANNPTGYNLIQEELKRQFEKHHKKRGSM